MTMRTPPLDMVQQGDIGFPGGRSRQGSKSYSPKQHEKIKPDPSGKILDKMYIIGWQMQAIISN
jgi:hypothetical protein